jgi:hypothetical protein
MLNLSIQITSKKRKGSPLRKTNMTASLTQNSGRIENKSLASHRDLSWDATRTMNLWLKTYSCMRLYPPMRHFSFIIKASRIVWQRRMLWTTSQAGPTSSLRYSSSTHRKMFLGPARWFLLTWQAVSGHLRSTLVTNGCKKKRFRSISPWWL